VRPSVIQISSSAIVPEAALLARIAAVATLPKATRRAYAIQLRDPELSGRELYAMGMRLRHATRVVGAALVVNDRLDLALGLRADGLHLGRRSISVADARAVLPAGTWISVSCHDVADVARAAREGADAALLSPIFPSPGKGTPLGLGALCEARKTAPDLLLVALGGVDAANAGACFAAGADAVAAIRADLSAMLTMGAPAR
jgi:thiamine-phosphate pyrophosphorylase